MTLRSRLVAILAALITLGLLVSGILTYGTLKNYLYDRVDEQLRSVQPQAVHALYDSVQGGGPSPDGSPGNLPIAVYAEIRDSSGRELGHVSFGFEGGETQYTPLIARSLHASPKGTLLTVPSEQSNTYQYRVLATALRGGTLLVAIPMADAQATLGRLLRIEVIVAAALLAAISLIAWALIRRELNPLDRMAQAATQIAAGDLSRRVDEPDARTEVGRLGRALNTMLAGIEQAFEVRRASEERMRRFLADASHELRTPLTSIRGYAELFRRGAAERPQDLELSMRRIEDEASRMGALVEELLLLAHVDQTRPMEEEEVDLSSLVRDAVEDAHARERRRTLETSIEDGVFLLGDSGRLLQAVGNLIGNAFVHTPSEGPVSIEMTADDSSALLTVADSGPGLTPEALQHVFDRFWRGDPSRARQSGGAGLGLAIVAAVAQAHGGSVTAGNRPDGGAVFTLRLPLLRSSEEGSIKSA
ncbi:MAG: two-component system, OmpR family, sensor kinase [Actinomycetota bacterium]|jgi:two-component system OmpR family sensor kinase|nr:two-component system, OmpR family, sensor kinase [Actinomycetota bacterium]